MAIGNSRGVRLPRELLAKYRIGNAVVLEELADGVLLRGKDGDRLNWEETYRQMRAEREDWTDLDSTVGDGLLEEPW